VNTDGYSDTEVTSSEKKDDDLVYVRFQQLRFMRIVQLLFRLPGYKSPKQFCYYLVEVRHGPITGTLKKYQLNCNYLGDLSFTISVT